ncbi:MAG: MarR family transcriptional regulator [Dehalococcoidia bacterium]
MAAWRSFLGAHARVIARLERELDRERGLPLTWYDVLVQLSEAEGGRLRMSDLAEAVLISRSGLTRLVDRMARAGLVERLPCPEDRRGTHVGLTQAGRAALDDASPVHLRGIQQHFARYLGDDEAEVLRAIFERIIAANCPRD